MNLRELPSPLRIYWDLPEAAPDQALCRRICEEIIETKMLFLSLRAPGSPVGCSFREVLDALKGDSIGISLTVPGSAATPSFLAGLSGSAVTTLLIDTSSLSEVRSFFEKWEPYGKGELTPGVSFANSRRNYREIPGVVSFCLQQGVHNLVFPIQRLGTEGAAYLEPEGGYELAAKLRAMDYSSMRITIHDPFLWQIFYPEADYHEGGCQAANSMLYLSRDYKVYPCPVMPLELGDLHETTLGEIINSAKKEELRQSLLIPPVDCAPCPQADKCLGGCRGRALASAGSLDRRDPACWYV
ncbi:MAG: SPASM domain-containing protein [Nitrospiraceae bacterium]|nr:SPASM domain-containing protein [Nitrospiraceae bacterium]